MTHAQTWPRDGWLPRRIAVLRALHLGDLLCATPALRALRRRFPSAEITLIGLPWSADLVGRLPDVDRFAPFPGYPGIPEVPYEPARTHAFLAEARARPFDLAIQMHGSGTASNGFIASLGATVTLGYRLLEDERLTIGLPYLADDHEVLRWLRLVAVLGAETKDTRLAFPTSTDEQQRAAVLLAPARRAGGPVIGLHVGGRGVERRWPAARFAALADAHTALPGSASERDVTRQVTSAIRAPVLDLAGQTDLGTFGALIAGLDLLITNDTGASHLAAACATPSVVLFATTSPYNWAPLDRDRHLVVDARTFAPPEMPGPEALAQLPIEPVLLACERLLGNVRARAGVAAGQ
mgnify:CR=1 FL=1